MIRLLLLSFIPLLFISCEDVYTQDDELFYQMSKTDSVRCMEEILDGMLEEATEEEQKIRDLLYNSEISFCGPRIIFDVSINSSGQVMVQNELDATDLSEKVYRFFMFNRFLTSDETGLVAMNKNHPGFEFPNYFFVTMEKIEWEIEKVKESLDEVKKLKEAEQAIVNFYSEELDEWDVLKNTLEITGDSELRRTYHSAFVQFSFFRELEISQEILKEIVLAFYQMRNYESIRYFGETYLHLYERAQRLNRKIDHKKLKALEVLHPAKIVRRDWSKKRPRPVQSPPEPTP